MNDHEFDLLLRASTPASDEYVNALDLVDAAADLRAAIVATGSGEPTPLLQTTTPRHTGSPRRWTLTRAGPRRTAFAVCALAAIAIGAGVGINGHLAGGPATAWSAEAVRFAESSPRLLISGGAYRVIRADQNGEFGEMVFTPVHVTGENQGGFENGASLMESGSPRGEFKASWYEGSFYSDRLAALTQADSGTTDLGISDVLGSGTRRFQFDGTTHFRALVLRDDYMIEVDGTASNKAAFDALLTEDASPNLGPEMIEPKQEIQASWLPARMYPQRIEGFGGKGTGDVDLGTTKVLGHSARWVKYDGADRFRAVWLEGDYTIEVDGIAANKKEFADVLNHMTIVDVDTWLRAMPESVVKPDNLSDVSEAMLADVPLPPNWENTGLAASVGNIRDRYQLGAAVTGAVVCGWLDEWLLAKHEGDATRVKAAATAMATSRRWKILVEMNATGGFPDEIWLYSDVVNGRLAAMPSGGAPQPDLTRVINGETITIPGTIGDYPAGLGCR
jgi:hypothetical protein